MRNARGRSHTTLYRYGFVPLNLFTNEVAIENTPMKLIVTKHAVITARVVCKRDIIPA